MMTLEALVLKLPLQEQRESYGLRIKAQASTNLEEVRRSVVVEAGQEAGDAVRAAAG